MSFSFWILGIEFLVKIYKVSLFMLLNDDGQIHRMQPIYVPCMVVKILGAKTDGMPLGGKSIPLFFWFDSIGCFSVCLENFTAHLYLALNHFWVSIQENIHEICNEFVPSSFHAAVSLWPSSCKVKVSLGQNRLGE